MEGIIVNSFESLMKNTDVISDDLASNISELRSAFLELRKTIRCSDLSFLTDKLSKDISQLNILIRKANSYQSSLKNILMAYKYQEQQIAASINRITP